MYVVRPNRAGHRPGMTLADGIVVSRIRHELHWVRHLLEQFNVIAVWSDCVVPVQLLAGGRQVLHQFCEIPRLECQVTERRALGTSARLRLTQKNQQLWKFDDICRTEPDRCAS